MRFQLVFFILMFLPSSNICASKVNLDVVPEELAFAFTSRNFRTDNVVTDKKTSGQDFKTKNKKETEDLIDDRDYNWSVLCGDHDMSYEGICYCGNHG